MQQEFFTVWLDGIGQASIPLRKLTQYALNYENAPDKARAFEQALGYNLTNFPLLLENLKRQIVHAPQIDKGQTPYGRRFQIIVELLGVNQKTAKVLTGWLIDQRTQACHLTTIHIDK